VKKELIPLEKIEEKIFLIRNQKVMLDFHLAELYDISTKVLIQAIKRNANRFPYDFMFQLTQEEYDNLRSQFVTSSWGGRRYLPYAFTEQGVAMLSSVLHSERAVLMNVAIMRTFVKLREILSTHKELAQRLAKLEEKISQHDTEIQNLFQAIRQLMKPSEKPKYPIGFIVGDQKNRYNTRKRK
jgi:phage regulator Rha-like protein